MYHNGPRASYRFVYGFEAIFAAKTTAGAGPWHHGLRCEALTEEEAHTLLAECQRAIQDTGSHLPLRMLAQDEGSRRPKQPMPSATRAFRPHRLLLLRRRLRYRRR